MRLLVPAALISAVLLQSGPAKAAQGPASRDPSTCLEAWQAARASGSTQSQKSYVRACESGRSNVAAQTSFPNAAPRDLVAPAPMPPTASGQVPGQPPQGAIALCMDGSYSTVPTHTGACDGHGGVTQFFK